VKVTESFITREKVTR